MKSKALPLILLGSLVLLSVTLSCQFATSLLGTSETPAPAVAITSAPPETGVTEQPIEATAAPADEGEQSIEPTNPQATEAGSEQTAPTSSPAESPAQAGPCTSKDSCIEDGNFLLARPVGGAGRKTIDISDRFGSYRSRTQDANHGVNFLNSTGTPVVAAADGVVVVAGDDSNTAYALRTNTYGNLVILKHDLPGISQPVYTLYAHLAEVSVKAKDEVKSGQQIGTVGMSGRVTGSTLHFEVRLGEDTYQDVRNPELWMELLPDENGPTQGALAGQILDLNGKYVQVSNIVLEQLAGPGQPAAKTIYLKTYAEKRLMGLSPWEENFAIGDLPAGDYQISFYWQNRLQQRLIKIKPGKLTSVSFQLQ